MKKHIKRRMVYTVMEGNAIGESFYSLSSALLYIGRRINQKHFGCMLVTVANAVREGYSINQYLEFV